MNIPTDTWITLTGEWVTSHPWYAAGFGLFFAAAVLLLAWPVIALVKVLHRETEAAVARWREARKRRAMFGPLTIIQHEKCGLTRSERERMSVIAAKYELTEAPEPMPARPADPTQSSARLLARAARRIRHLTTTRGGNR